MLPTGRRVLVPRELLEYYELTNKSTGWTPPVLTPSPTAMGGGPHTVFTAPYPLPPVPPATISAAKLEAEYRKILRMREEKDEPTAMAVSEYEKMQERKLKYIKDLRAFVLGSTDSKKP